MFVSVYLRWVQYLHARGGRGNTERRSWGTFAGKGRNRRQSQRLYDGLVPRHQRRSVLGSTSSLVGHSWQLLCKQRKQKLSLVNSTPRAHKNTGGFFNQYRAKRKRVRTFCAFYYARQLCVLAMALASLSLCVTVTLCSPIKKVQARISKSSLCTDPRSLVFLLQFCAHVWGGFPQTKASRRDTFPPLKDAILPLLARLVWKKLQIGPDILLSITSTGDALFRFINIDNLKRP